MTETLTKPEAAPKTKEQHSSGNFARRIFAVSEVGVLIPLVGFILIFYLINPAFLSPAQVTTMLRSMSFVGVIAMGQTFLLITGAFDLSVGAVAGLSGIIFSYLMVRMHLPVPVAIIGGLATGAVVGLANSFVVLKLGVPAFIATLGMLNIAKGITYLISKGYTIYPLPESVQKFGTAEP
ncbi:MAG TPA: ABC transporter permease, partial [Anaerolineales bacterium]